MTDYSKMSNDELIALLEKRDAQPDDLIVLNAKVEKFNVDIVNWKKRMQELPNISYLSEDEKSILRTGLQARIDAKTAELKSITDMLMNIKSG